MNLHSFTDILSSSQKMVHTMCNISSALLYSLLQLHCQHFSLGSMQFFLLKLLFFFNSPFSIPLLAGSPRYAAGQTWLSPGTCPCGPSTCWRTSSWRAASWALPRAPSSSVGLWETPLRGRWGTQRKHTSQKL